MAVKYDTQEFLRMIIFTEKNQDFLKLMHLIQNNRSSTLARIHKAADAILTQKVYAAVDHTKGGKPYYSLEPIEDITEANKPEPDKGGRPRSLTAQQVSAILNDPDNRPHAELAREYKVSEGTIRNVRKKTNGAVISEA